MKTIRIEKMDHQGRGIGYLDGKICFIPNALPNELCQIEIVKENKKMIEAKVINWLEISDKRVKPICPYYDVCGGCDIMHLSYQEQLEYKQHKVEEIMVRYGDVDKVLIKPIIGMGHPLYYRNKVTFQVKSKIGFYGKGSYDLIPIKKCYLISDAMNQVLQYLQAQDLEGLKQVVVRSNVNDEVMLILKGKPNQINTWQPLPKEVKTLIQDDNHKIEKEYLNEQLNSYTYFISPSAFFQVNHEGTIALYETIKKYASLTGTERVLDLYCGTGTIGIYLSKEAKEVVGIELNEEAIKDAKKNALYNYVSNASFLAGDSNQLVFELQFRPDVIIVDPPRAGLEAGSIDYLLHIEAKKIIYVSCDPMTLARDLKRLKDQYAIQEITPVDMFPQTRHVECVCLLKRQ